MSGGNQGVGEYERGAVAKPVAPDVKHSEMGWTIMLELFVVPVIRHDSPEITRMIFHENLAGYNQAIEWGLVKTGMGRTVSMK